jgi:hypothetical protein
MKHLLNTLFIALAMLTPVASVAQRSIILEAQKHTKGGRTIVGAYKVATPLDAFVIMQGGTTGEPTATLDGTKATLEIIPFGTQGRTVTITLNIPKMERSEEIDGTTFSWSGKVDVAPTIEGENSGFMITRRGNTLCAMLAYTEGKWVLCVNKDDGTGLIGTLKKGISRAQVEDECKGLGLSKFKFTRKSGNLDVYSLFWLNQTKQWNAFGTNYHYALRNDKKYGDFYFNAQGKLVKWFMYFD